MSTETKIYFNHGDLVAESGDARVYVMDEQLYLEVGQGHNLWALESEYVDYMAQLVQRQPRGKCLEIGLGLGVASRCIMTCPEVEHLTTVEQNRNVIATHESLIYFMDNKLDKWAPYDYNKHDVVWDEGLNFLNKTRNTDDRFDFIFLDFYKMIDEDSLPVIKDMTNAARECLSDNGFIMGWLDPHTPPDFYKEFEDIFK